MNYKKNLITNLKKANSLSLKVMKMLEWDKYCIDIIQQNLAIIWILKSVNLELLKWHMNCCIKDAILQKDEEKLDKMMEELLKVMKTAQNK